MNDVRFETAEVSEAKDAVQEIVSQAYDYLDVWEQSYEGPEIDPIALADQIVERLIEMGWVAP